MAEYKICTKLSGEGCYCFRDGLCYCNSLSKDDKQACASLYAKPAASVGEAMHVRYMYKIFHEIKTQLKQR